MSKQRIKMLAGVSFGLLAVALWPSVAWAAPPVHEVILESDSWPMDPEFWAGPAIIWIDGTKYAGSILYTGVGKMNENSWHGTEVKVYDFGALGILELEGTAKTSFAYVSPEHRWHRYTSHAKIVGGTGAFEQARGVFQFVGYTDWDLTGSRPPHAFEGTQASIVGIQVNGP